MWPGPKAVWIQDPNPARAAIKAQGIFEYLGRDFFKDMRHYDDADLVRVVTRWIKDDGLHVEFNELSDALMFKLTWGGK